MKHLLSHFVIFIACKNIFTIDLFTIYQKESRDEVIAAEVISHWSSHQQTLGNGYVTLCDAT